MLNHFLFRASVDTFIGQRSFSETSWCALFSSDPVCADGLRVPWMGWWKFVVAETANSNNQKKTRLGIQSSLQIWTVYFTTQYAGLGRRELFSISSIFSIQCITGLISIMWVWKSIIPGIQMKGYVYEQRRRVWWYKVNGTGSGFPLYSLKEKNSQNNLR